VLGEYLWRILDEARGRPLYLVERTLGLPIGTATSPEPTVSIGLPR
jgi:hypothetical protein